MTICFQLNVKEPTGGVSDSAIAIAAAPLLGRPPQCVIPDDDVIAKLPRPR